MEGRASWRVGPAEHQLLRRPQEVLCWLGPLPATPLTPPDPAGVTLQWGTTPTPPCTLPALSLGPGLPGGACSLSRHRARPPACSQPLTSPVPCPSPRQPSHLLQAEDHSEPMVGRSCYGMGSCHCSRTTPWMSNGVTHGTLPSPIPSVKLYGKLMRLRLAMCFVI